MGDALAAKVQSVLKEANIKVDVVIPVSLHWVTRDKY